MNLNRARDEKQARELKEAIELCGKNRGPHDYIPIEWRTANDIERVTRLLCRICFRNISMKYLIENYPEINVE
jgi:hypothetical protein